MNDSVRVAKAHTLQQLEKVILRKEEILDNTTIKPLQRFDYVNQHTLVHSSILMRNMTLQ